MKSIPMSQSDNKMQMTILLFGMIEMIIGFSGVILADFYSIFNLLTLLSGVAGVVGLLFCILQPSKIKVYDMMAMALVLAYGTGTLNSLVRYTVDGLDLLKSSYVEEYWLTRALGLVTAASGFLHILGRFDSNGYLFKNFAPGESHKKRFKWFAFIIISLAIFFVYTGKIGFMGSVAIAKGYVNVSPTSSILLDLIIPVGAVSLYLGLKEDSPKIKGFFIAIAIALLLIQFGFGRRLFVFSSLIYLMLFFFAKNSSGILSLKQVVIFVIFGITVQIATTSFSVLRISSYQYKGPQKTIFEMLPDAIKVYEDKDFYHVDEKINENLRSRSFVLQYLASIDKSLSTIQPTNGNNLLRALTVSIPRILYPSKYSNELFISEEGLINPHFKLINTDNSNTIQTGSLADFGEAGVFFLPLIFCFIYSRILSACRKNMNPIGAMLISLFIAYRLLLVEGDITVQFSTLRNILFFSIILWVVFNFNKKNKSLR